eukprot:IDg6959t1
MQQLSELNMAPTVPMDTSAGDVSTIFSMAPAFAADSALASNSFAAAMDQMMAGQMAPGLEPATRARAAAPSSQESAQRASVSSSPPSPPAALAVPTPFSGPGLPVVPPVPKHGPMSRRRGLAYAQHVKTVAREEFKDRRRHELEARGEGERTKRRKKNDTSMSEHQKYRRRLQKNQDSAAAARFASEAYLNNLELQVQNYDTDMAQMAAKLRRAEAERDEVARINNVLMSHTRSLEAELQAIRERAVVQCTPQKQSTASVAVAVDELVAAWGAAAVPTEPQMQASNPPPYKALFEEYSAPSYDFSTEFPGISVGHIIGTKPPAAF